MAFTSCPRTTENAKRLHQHNVQMAGGCVWGAHFLTALEPLLGILDGKKIEKIDSPRLN